MTINYLSLLVCIIGGVLFLVVKPEYGDVKAMAKDCFWVGLFVFLLQAGAQTVTLFK
jgi:hypothetical protein